jgi:hypothetical protein
LKKNNGSPAGTRPIEQFGQTAREQGRNAVYNFLIDLMRVQRSLGKFFLFAPEDESQAFMERLDQFMETQGVR